MTTLCETVQQTYPEPVAWMVYTKDGNGAYVTDNPTDIKPDQQAFALWAWPREWQGLTDEEIGLLTTGDEWAHLETPVLASFARAIEAKLREKNS